MSQNQNCERLFLLETFVVHLKVRPSVLLENNNEEENEDTKRTFCFTIRLGYLPCFELCRDVNDNDGDYADDAEAEDLMVKFNWNEGKNCLFPMKAAKLAKIIADCPLIMVFRQKLLHEDSFEIAGRTEISLGQEMLEMVRGEEHWLSDSPVTETIQDEFELLAADGTTIGKIHLVLRLTCLGTTVFTNFEVANRKFTFNKDKSRIDNVCKVCAPGKVVSCAEPERKPSEPAIPKEVEAAESSVVVLANRNHSELACSCSNLIIPQKKKPAKQSRKPRKKNPTIGPAPAEVPAPAQRRHKQFLPGKPNRRGNGEKRHVTCLNLDSPVPAIHGWAWSTKAPPGLKFSEIQGWQPGYFRKCYLRSLKIRPKVKLLSRMLVTEKEKGSRCRPKTDVVPTVRLARGNGQCHITYAPNSGDCKMSPQEYEYSVGSDDSDVEVTVDMPELPCMLPRLRHQAQQFCEEDFPAKKSKKVKSKAKISGRTAPKKGVQKKKSKIAVKPQPWDHWIMMINCKSDLKKWRPEKILQSAQKKIKKNLSR